LQRLLPQVLEHDDSFTGEQKERKKEKLKATLQVACLFACFAVCVSLLADFRFPSLLTFAIFGISIMGFPLVNYLNAPLISRVVLV
jgi:hypothetical protein